MIKYLQLHKPLSLPGQGTAKKWSANGQPGHGRTGLVCAIHETAKGYELEIVTGPHRGRYEILNNMVEHAFRELEPVAVTPLVQATENVTDAATGAEPKPQRKTKTPKA